MNDATHVSKLMNATMNAPRLTDEQEYAIKTIPEQATNKVVEARAGTGKTFLIAQLANAISPFKKILYVTFSKALVDEAMASGKFPKNVDIKTAHSLAYGPAKKFYTPAKPMSVSNYTRTKAMFEMLDDPMYDLDVDDDAALEMANQLRNTFKDLLQFAQVNLVNPKDEDAIDEIVKYYGIPVGLERPTFYDHLRRAMKWSAESSGCIGFTDMVWGPVSMGLPMPKYDVILADEIQDSSIMLIELYKQCLKPGGYIVGVGDDWQAIYGFAGSRNESMQIFKDTFQCETLGLTVNFRCGRAHIENAQRLVPDIKAHDGAIDGIIEEGEFDPEHCKSGDLIICRTNAPLVAPCLKLVKAGIKANIKGRDVAAPIMSLLDKVKSYRIVDAIDKVLKLQDNELMLAGKRKFKQATVDAINDRYSIALDFLKDSGTVTEAKDKLKDIFSDDTPGVVFCSAHRSKGLQAKSVTILNHDKIRISRPDMESWQHEQEKHLEYVALTRPQEILRLVPSDRQPKAEPES